MKRFYDEIHEVLIKAMAFIIAFLSCSGAVLALKAMTDLVSYDFLKFSGLWLAKVLVLLVVFTIVLQPFRAYYKRLEADRGGKTKDNS